MSGEAVAKVQEITAGAAPNVRRRGRRAAASHEEKAAPRFFLGDADAHGIALKKECTTEAEAQLESLKHDRPYYSVEAWQAVPDLTTGIIAVQKKAVRKT